MHKIIISVILLAILLAGCSERVKVTFVPRSAEEMVKLKITSPQNGEVINSDSVKIAFETENFNVSSGNNEIHFILDNGPRMVHKSNELFFLSSLKEGRHIIRAFPAKGWGESIKDPESMAIVQFFVKSKNSELLNTNIPMLTYNEPAGFFKGENAKRILLDFLVSNTVLSKKGYNVVYKLDGVPKTLVSVSPIYLTNLGPGKHTIELELVDKNGNLAEGHFVKTQREIIILEDKTQ